MTRPPDTTFVVTSCGRFDLLAETMLTFLEFNTAPIARYLVAEDSGNAAVRDVLGGLDVPIEFLVHDPPVGQMASIDRAYAVVDTPYVFHCEDDWRFLRSGFVEESRVVLDARDDVSMVLCRRLGQQQGNDILFGCSPRHSVGGVDFRVSAPDVFPQWGGYTFNPGLRRLADIRRVGSFAALGQEVDASVWFKARGMAVAFLESPAYETTGALRHVATATSRAWRPVHGTSVVLPDAKTRDRR